MDEDRLVGFGLWGVVGSFDGVPEQEPTATVIEVLDAFTTAVAPVQQLAVAAEPKARRQPPSSTSPATSRNLHDGAVSPGVTDFARAELDRLSEAGPGAENQQATTRDP